MPDELKNKEVQVGDKIIGANTLIRFNLKTLSWIFGILYVIGAWAYFDLRTEIKDANSISKKEKTEFLEDVEDEWDDKLDKLIDLQHAFNIEQALMKGDIKVILDRNQRNNNIQPNTSLEVTPTQPPGSQEDIN